jgi:hypothetical protein
MARCPDCNKFVSYDDGDVDVQSEDVESDEVRVEVRIVKTCAECGTELKEATLELHGPFEHDCEAPTHDGEPVDADEMEEAEALVAFISWLLGHEDPNDDAEHARETWLDGHELTVESNLENDSWCKGKGRYTQTFYGVSGEIEVSCTCGFHETISVSVQDDGAYTAASGMDDLT